MEEDKIIRIVASNDATPTKRITLHPIKLIFQEL